MRPNSGRDFLINHNLNLMKKLLLGMAIIMGAMMFSNSNVQADQPIGCYLRMDICGGAMNAFHCDGIRTSDRCSRYEVGCKFC